MDPDGGNTKHAFCAINWCGLAVDLLAAGTWDPTYCIAFDTIAGSLSSDQEVAKAHVLFREYKVVGMKVKYVP